MKRTSAPRAPGLPASAVIDLYDHLLDALDRLEAVADLLAAARDDLAARTVVGVGWMLKDLHRRLESTVRDAHRVAMGQGGARRLRPDRR